VSAAGAAIDATSRVFWEAVAPLAVQATVVALLVLVVDRLLPRRTWPELRSLLWLLVLVRLVLPPSLASPVGLGRVLPEALVEVSTPAELASLGDDVRPWAQRVAVAWFVGVVAVALLELVRRLMLRRRLRTTTGTGLPPSIARAAAAAAKRLGARRRAEIRVGPIPGAPFVTGLLRPVVVLPPHLEPEHTEPVLLHELAHVERRDLWMGALGATLRSVYWFHPLVWVTVRRLSVLRELGCDRTVLRALAGEAHALRAYRRTLLALATRRLGVARSGIAFLRRRSEILTRLHRLDESDAGGDAWRRSVTTLASILALGCVLPLAPAAEITTASVAEKIRRPPGCLELRYLVLARLAEERRARAGDPQVPTTTSFHLTREESR
jgi:bla regulator protein BlaR1